MTKRIMLDSGPLGQLARKTPPPALLSWYESIVIQGGEIIIPEVADYEIRRELLRAGMTSSLMELNRLKVINRYDPISTSMMLKAAELWAQARNRGRPTAHEKSLDVDVILAAQAIKAGAVIATENVAHLSQFVTAADWRTIRPD